MLRFDKYFFFLLLILLLIFLFSFAIRVYQVDSRPQGVLVDEASYGYNAYSILKTGRDEHGISYPLIIKAFGDQKLPAYTYATVVSFAIFGFNTFALRLPSVLAGSLFPLALYFLLTSIGFSKRISIIGSMFAAVSPWSIILSRFTYESNLALLFFTTGLGCGFHYMKNKKTVFAILSGILLGLTWYSYIAYRLITVALLLALLLLGYIHYKMSIRRTILILLTFLIVITPILPSAFSSQGTARFNQIGLFSESGIPLEVNESRTYCDEDLPRIPCYLNSNKPVIYARTLVHRLFESFSISYLFFKGEKDLDFLSIKNFGLLPTILIPFYLIGILILVQKLISRKKIEFELFLVVSLVVSAIPSILAGDPQRVRISALFPFLLILIAYGINECEKYFPKEKIKVYFLIFLTGFSIFSGLAFMMNYLTIHIKKHELTYGSYLSPLSKYLHSLDKKSQIFIKPQTEFITYFAYYNGIDPSTYQKETKWYEPNEIGFQHPTDFQNIHVKDIHPDLLFCLAKAQNKPIILVTNEDLTEMIGKKTLMKSFQSYNGVYTYSYVYNINARPGNAVLDCDKRNIDL